MIKAVVVDLDGVYFSKGKDVFIENIVERYNVSEDDVKTMFLSSNDMNEYKKGMITDEVYWMRFRKKLGISASTDELITMLMNGYEVDEQIEKLVISFKKRILKTVICTNNFQSRIEGLDEKFHFLDHFNVKVLSYEVGFLKPDEEMFLEVSKRTGLPNEEILFIDNGKENLRELKALGFVVIWYENYLKLMEELEAMKVIT